MLTIKQIETHILELNQLIKVTIKLARCQFEVILPRNSVNVDLWQGAQPAFKILIV